jgi:hypothetical protein
LDKQTDKPKLGFGLLTQFQLVPNLVTTTLDHEISADKTISPIVYKRKRLFYHFEKQQLPKDFFEETTT